MATDQTAARDRQIAERAADTLAEWLAEQALEDAAPLDALRREDIAGGLCGFFSYQERESEEEAAKCWHAMERELAAAGGLVYVPDLDGAPCITTAEQLRVMGGRESWADAMAAFHAVPLVKVTPAIVGHVVFKHTGEHVRISDIDGGCDSFGQFVCFEATTDDGEAVAQVTVRDDGALLDQQLAAREEFKRLGFKA